jgi:hypothetical protein
LAEIGVVSLDPILARRVENVEIDGVFEGVGLVGDVGRDAEDLAGADDEVFAPLVGFEEELERTLEDVADLLVMVMVHGDDGPLLEEDTGKHGSGSDHELASDMGA